MPKTEADKQILKSLAQTKEGVSRDLEGFEFSRALHTAYDFFWHEFCDVYIEAGKKQLADPALMESTQALLLHTLKESLKLLHPFMPFVTEAVWEKVPGAANLLMVELWGSEPAPC